MIWTSKHVSGKRSLPWPEHDGDNDKQQKRTPCKYILLSFERAAARRGPNSSKQACRDPSVVTLSLYSAVQRAGDSYDQQVTVAGRNAGQMVIQGVAYVGEGQQESVVKIMGE